MNGSLTNKRIALTGFYRAALVGLIAALLMSVTVAYTVALTDLGTSNIKLGKETFSDDPDVVVASKRIYKASANTSAVGESPPGVEVTSALPQINNAISKNKYIYEFEVKEATTTSFQSGENFKVEVYMDDSSTTSLLTTLYTKQDTVDDSNVEGVIVAVDTGSTTAFGNVFSILITRQ